MTDDLYGWRNDPDVPVFPDDRPLMVFDGECVLCSGAAQFILSHDRGGRILLTHARSPLGLALYRHFGLPTSTLDTVLFVDRGRVHVESDAVLRLARALGWPWRLGEALRVIPRFVRDPLYLWIARRRYRLFGRRATCWLPSPQTADRLI